MEAGGDRWYLVAVFTKNKKGKVDGINIQLVRMIITGLIKCFVNDNINLQISTIIW